jgi:zinc protease
MAAALYGPRHAYGFTELGTEAGVKSVTRDDIAAFWNRISFPTTPRSSSAAPSTPRTAQPGGKGVCGLGRGHAGETRARLGGTTSAKVVVVDLPGAADAGARGGRRCASIDS